MKHLFNFILCLLLSSTFVFAQDSISINVPTAGQIKAAIVSAGGNANNIKKMNVTGIIDARDFKFMRDTMPNLEAIYLKNVTIAFYSGFDGTAGYGNNYAASAIPEFAFSGKSSLKFVELPTSTRVSKRPTNTFQNRISVLGMVFK